MSEDEKYSYIFEDRCLRLETKTLYVFGKSYKSLTDSAFKVLFILLENQGKYVEADALARQVYEIEEIKEKESDLVKKAKIKAELDRRKKELHGVILHLREILTDFQGNRVIKREYGRGYCFIAEAKKIPDEDLDFSSELLAPPAFYESDINIIHPELSIEDPDVDTPSPEAENSTEGLKTFEAWLFGSGKKISLILLICVVSTLASSLIFFFLAVTGIIKFDLSKPIAALSQCLTILFAFYYAKKNYETKEFPFTGNEQTDEKVTNSSTMIRKHWLGLLLSWFLLYLFLTFYFGEKSFRPDENMSTQPGALALVTNFLATTFNYLNTMFIVYCFTYLNEQGEEDEESTKNKFKYLIGLLWGITLTVYIISFYISGQNKNVSIILDFSTGIVGGIAMALFVGRLQSKFFGTKPWLLIFLYSYTAIQPLYFYLTLNDEGADPTADLTNKWLSGIGIVLLINLYFALKCLLYLYLAWSFESTRLSFYLVKIREKHKDIESNWKKWLRDLREIQNKPEKSDV